MAWRGTSERLKWGIRREKQNGRIFFGVGWANGIHRCCVLVEVWFQLQTLCVMFKPLNQACSLCRCYPVHVAGQLGHTHTLKTCTLSAKERRSIGLRVATVCQRSMSIQWVCRMQKDRDVRDKQVNMNMLVLVWFCLTNHWSGPFYQSTFGDSQQPSPESLLSLFLDSAAAVDDGQVKSKNKEEEKPFFPTAFMAYLPTHTQLKQGCSDITHWIRCGIHQQMPQFS